MARTTKKKKKASKKAAASKPPTKSEVFATIAEQTELSKRDVAGVFDALQGVIKTSLRKHQAFTLPGLAKQVVGMAADAGVKLTPAGATYPYGNDPEDRNIRLAPSVPTMEEIDQAMAVFVTCVQLASVRQKLA